MKKLLIYPFTFETVQIARYHNDLVDYNEVIFVAEEGSTVSGISDISDIDGGNSKSIYITTDFMETLHLVDDVLFVDDFHNIENFHSNFILAEKTEKSIILCGNFTNISSDKYKKFQKQLKIKDIEQITSQNMLYEIPVPVVLVLGLGQQCNKFDIQLMLRQKFLEHDYIVSQVGTKSYSPLFGFHALPLFSQSPLWEKILLYNRFFRNIVDEENSDILIVGVLGGIMPIDEYHNEMFGETAIAITKSLLPDISILSTYLDNISNIDIEGLTNFTKYALGATLDYIHISNNKLVFEPDLRSINYLVTDSSIMFNEQEENINFFNVFLQRIANAVYNKILTELQDNLETI